MISRPSLILATFAVASPALAHEGAHLHPHADSAVWGPILAGLLAVAGAALIAWRQK
ncbi:hypothetical protein R5H30_05035 [Sulfitobacter sp. D35]|uniref:hypothetical protein n=1 Tax=Sulfitobacter sp. D35 TaxID=3083252 RepID=UPI00296E6164|nr:hypothetical protein [Sulfitobacter sp. D35]MDW4497337.1 hypothetical protein [Sulfitobacter sp. D35]